MIQPDAERFQFRVGHGGFHATLVHSPSPITYVYDVGAQPSKSLLRKAIGCFVKELQRRAIKRIDYVVISHIDEDHVNGLDDLLTAASVAKIAVGTVVLPWLTPTQKLLVQAGNSHRQQSATVTQLGGTDGQADAHIQRLGAEHVRRVVSEPDQDDQEPSEDLTGQNDSAGIVGSCTNVVGSSSGWELIPVRLVPPSSAEQAFETHLRTSLGKHSRKNSYSHVLDPRIISDHSEILTNFRPLVRDAMKHAAAQVRGVTPSEITNWSSLALLSGAKNASSPCQFANWNQGIYQRCAHLWLHTGDLPLAKGKAWSEFSARLGVARRGRRLCVLIAPHHGSRLSHQPNLYRSSIAPGTVLFTTGRTANGSVAKRINTANAKAAAQTNGAAVIDLHN